LAVKKAILVVVRLVLVDCLIHFGIGLQLDAERPEVTKWLVELDRAKAIFEGHAPLGLLKLPFGVPDFKDATRFQELHGILKVSDDEVLAVKA
jgi:hypothetical protein